MMCFDLRSALLLMGSGYNPSADMNTAIRGGEREREREREMFTVALSGPGILHDT